MDESYWPDINERCGDPLTREHAMPTVETLADTLKALCDKSDADEIVRLLNELRCLRGDFAGKMPMYFAVRKYMAQVLVLKAMSEAK